MAIPPEPIEELLPTAALIVEAEVSKVISLGKKPPTLTAPKDHTSTGQKNASQQLSLKVARVLKGALPGDAAAPLEVSKPEGAYTLREGSKGAFLLSEGEGGWVILGRYGPDTYTVESVELTLKAMGG